MRREVVADDCFRLHFEKDRCRVTFDFDASRPNIPVVEVYADSTGGLLTPQDALALGVELVAWARRQQQCGGESP